MLIGILTTAGNQLIVIGYTLDKAGRVASLLFVEVPLSYLTDIIFFGYVLGTVEFVGGLLVIASALFTFWLKYKEN